METRLRPPADGPGPSPVPEEHGRGRRSGRAILHWAAAAAVGMVLWAASLDKPFFNPDGSPKKILAAAMAKALADAVVQFHEDHGRLPLPGGARSGTSDPTTDSSAESGLIRILLGLEPEGTAKQNTTGINYLEGLKFAERGAASKASQWVGGLVPVAGVPAVMDPWGHLFRITFDTDGNGEVDNPDREAAADGLSIVKTRCIAWSPGKDGAEETWEDNPKSWR